MVKGKKIGHATERARERYDLSLSADDFHLIRNRIRKGEAKLVRRKEQGKAVYDVKFNGQVLRVLCAPNGFIISIVPSHRLELNLGSLLKIWMEEKDG